MNKKKRFMAAFLKPCAGRITLLWIMTLIQSVLQVGMAFLSRYVIDAALYSGDLLLWGGLLVADILVLVAVHTALAWMTGSTMDLMVTRLRGRLLRAAAYSRDVRLQQFHSGQLLSRGLEDVAQVCDGAVHALPALVGQISSLIAAFVAVLLISPAVAWVMLAAAVMIILLTAFLRPVLKKHHRTMAVRDRLTERQYRLPFACRRAAWHRVRNRKAH